MAQQTAKEKAEELVNRFAKLPEEGTLMWHLSFEISKKCALIAIDEILEATKTKYKWGGGSPEKLVHLEEVKYDTYWQKVKQEIEKL